MPSLTATLIARLWATATTIAAPALRLMLHRRIARGKELAARLPERQGHPGHPRPPGRLLWLHAASVGETLSALPLITALPADVTILFTTGTLTSATLLQTRLEEANLAHRVIHQFVPLDVPSWAARFLDAWRPNAACFLESELWPNLLAACRVRHIPTALINARLSARSARQWARAPAFARHILAHFTWIAAQSTADATRLQALGAPNTDFPGNLKHAAPPLPDNPAERHRLKPLTTNRPAWLAASTHPADDALIAATHQALLPKHPNLLTAIAPRHPTHGAALAQALQAPQRSKSQDPPAQAGLWIADTIGELGLLYRLFPIVLIGKSFQNGGGQNPWEAAQLGCTILTGPNMENFPEATAHLAQAGALTQHPNQAALIAHLDALLSNPAQLAATAQAARQATAAASNLPEILAARLAALMPQA